MRPPKQSSSQCLRDKASSALECATGKPGADLPAFAPNHFVGGLFARQAQDKLVGHFKIMRGADAYTAVGSVDHETKLLWRARLGHDDREVPELATQRATSIRKCGPDHMSPTVLAKHRRSLLAQISNSLACAPRSNSRCILEKSAVADAFRLILTVCEGRCRRIISRTSVSPRRSRRVIHSAPILGSRTSCSPFVSHDRTLPRPQFPAFRCCKPNLHGFYRVRPLHGVAFQK